MLTPQKREKLVGDPVPLFDKAPADTSPTFELLTIPEVADLLRISETGVRRLLEKRTLPFIKIGGSVRLAKSDLATYLQKRRVESVG